MILLNGHSLAPVRKIPAEALSLNLTERDSTAQLTPADMTGIGINSWMQDDTNPGKGIVWRVKSIRDTFATRTPTVTLEHMINSLRDRIIFGEVKASDITGTGSDRCSALQAVRYILGHQGDWILGDFDYSGVSAPYKFDGDTLYDALETVSNTLDDCWWSYDFSSYPFRLSITRRSSEVGSQMRAGRNITTITKTVDKTGMYTRFYPIGKEDLHISGDYVEKNAGVYGILSKVETDQSLETESALRSWANERLEKHAEPTVTVNVAGFELANATGESLDRLQLGRKCKIPLPEFGTEIVETITQLSYQDKIHTPEAVQVTMANNRVDITRIVADAIRQSAGGGRASARKEKEDHAWFEDTNDHVAMCAEGIIGKDAYGNPNWIRLSQIVVDGQGIYSSVQSLQQDMVVANTKITQNENRIILEAERARAAEGNLSGRITVAANAITAEVTRAKAEENSLSGRITVNSDKVSLVVSETVGGYAVNAASIVLGINAQTGSYVDIEADKINLSGYVTASELYATDAKIDNLTSGAATAQTLKTYLLSASTGFTYQGYSISFKTITVGGNTYYLLGR